MRRNEAPSSAFRRAASACACVSRTVQLVAVSSEASKQAPRARPPLATTRIASGPETLAEARKFLEGRWALESFEVHPPGKLPITLKGSGVLNDDDFGNMRMEIRAEEAASDLLRAAGDQYYGRRPLERWPHSDRSAESHPHVFRRRPTFLDGHGRRPLTLNRPRHCHMRGIDGFVSGDGQAGGTVGFVAGDGHAGGAGNSVGRPTARIAAFCARSTTP